MNEENENGIISLPVASKSRLGLIHTLTINKKTKHVHCSCESYHYNILKNNPYCKHTKEYRDLIYKTLYGNDTEIIKSIIKSFKTIKSKVRDIIKDFPELIGQPYKKIWGKIEERYPELKSRKTTTERCYRKLISDAKLGFEPDIEIPIDVELRTKKEESVMHDINNWDQPWNADVVDFRNHQSSIVKEEF